MSTPQAQTVRRWVMTGSVAAITATGALYGAGLKTRREHKEEKRQRSEATPAEQIQHLETLRDRLLLQKKELQKKMDEIALRQRKQSGQS